MKRLFTVALVCLLLLSGCAAAGKKDAAAKNGAGTQAVDAAKATDNVDIKVLSPTPSAAKDVIKITEKLFIAQTNDIYVNTDDYLGKTIQFEGIFQSYYYDVTDTTYYSVIRYGPGCCGYDANPGFEVVWPGDGDYPEQDDWVEAVGTLGTYEEGGAQYLRLELSSLKVLPTRGAEYVQQ